MRILIGLAIVMTLALAASSKRWWSLRRTRVGAALSTGGWLMVAMGFVLGPHVTNMVQREQVLAVQPLIVFVLGWVGMMVGFGLQRDLIKKVPAVVFGITLADVVISMLLIGGAGWFLLYNTNANSSDWDKAVLALLIAVCAVGWPAEVRSLRQGGVVGGHEVAAVIRVVAGLGAILAIAVYGLLIKGVSVDSAQGAVSGFSIYRMAIGLGISLVIGVSIGVVGKWLMGVAGKGDAEFLVVLLGLVSLVAGAAATLDYSPLFVAMICGAVVVNMQGKSLQRFKRVILEAEQPVAMMLMLVAGVLADGRIGLIGLVLLCVLLVMRFVVKHMIVRRLIGQAMKQSGPSASMTGLLRQAPLAIALAVAYVISSHGQVISIPLTGQQILMVVILAGLLSDAAELLRFGRVAQIKSELTEHT